MILLYLAGISLATHRLCEAACRQQLRRHVGHSAVGLGGDVGLLVHIQHPRQPKVCQLHSAQRAASAVRRCCKQPWSFGSEKDMRQPIRVIHQCFRAPLLTLSPLMAAAVH